MPDIEPTAPVTVAVVTGPDEVVCPNCEQTIRARMSDATRVERKAALEDLEHALTLALQAMATNDCCADEDDPDWRGPAIEQFRKDLRALGTTDAEMDAAGISLSTEQDGQQSDSTHEQLHSAVNLAWPCRYGDAECPVLIRHAAEQDGQR